MSRLVEFSKHVSRNCNSYSRLKEIIGCRDYLTLRNWCRLLGENWTTYIRQHRLPLRKLLGTVGPIREMMTREENVYYDTLPDLVTCYRGCESSVLPGASWSLDWDVANSFPFTNRYKVPSPVIITARVEKCRILAVKLGRGELEIVTFSAMGLSIEKSKRDAGVDSFTVEIPCS